jgi:hypothetical protein
MSSRWSGILGRAAPLFALAALLAGACRLDGGSRTWAALVDGRMATVSEEGDWAVAVADHAARELACPRRSVSVGRTRWSFQHRYWRVEGCGKARLYSYWIDCPSGMGDATCTIRFESLGEGDAKLDGWGARQELGYLATLATQAAKDLACPASELTLPEPDASRDVATGCGHRAEYACVAPDLTTLRYTCTPIAPGGLPDAGAADASGRDLPARPK